MSITVRLWSEEDLAAIKLGEDKKLITIFLNGNTFSEEEIVCYPHHLRHTYSAEWEELEEPVKFYATDDETAIWFLQQEYTSLPAYLWEITTNYREVELPTKP